ncbi:serine hydrolase [Mycobacterium sp. 1274761.0]|uniref:serine hydrolase n=1 Tax=Mycobacterium sp. 1274761.0 TaxID=1834077 RepID=UPI0012E81445|nr:serine hydrolase [Mycobacterium sp. 1274761.0]
MAARLAVGRVIVFAAAMSLLAACGGDSGDDAKPAAEDAKPTLSDVPPPLVPAMPLPDNAVDNAVAKLDGIADDLMKRSGIPGLAVAVVHGGKTVYAKGFGVRDVKTGDRVDADTVFQLASVSKSISSTVVAHQVGVNAIGWDTPIVDKLPWFGLSDAVVTKMVTIGDMFSHRSGLPDHAGDKLEDLGYDRRYVLDRLRNQPLAPFRISYAYTNFGLTSAAEAVAAGAGKPWDVLADEALLKPLGMPSTSFRFGDYAARTNRAIGHLHVDGKYEPLDTRNADPEAPAGGASSSVNDMTHWLAMVLANGSYAGKPIVDPKALLPAVTPQIVSSPASEPAMRSGFYGFGFNVGTTSAARTELSHSGAFELGAGTNFVVLPSADVAIIALTNATPSGVPEALTAQFADLVQFGEVREDWFGLYNRLLAPMEKPVGSLVGQKPPANPAPSAPRSSYVGTYHNDYWGPARVSEKDGNLHLELGSKLSVPLMNWNGNSFTYEWVSENSPPGSVGKATFDGNKLTLEYYDDDGKGTFTR